MDLESLFAMLFAYTILLALALVVTLPYWAVQAIRHGKYRAGLRERLGAVPTRLRTGDPRPAIWVHAVSVGEVLAVVRLVHELRTGFPNRRVVVSTTTATGQKLARERFGEADVFYFPLDFPFAISAYLRVLRPELVVVAETEFWPNFLRAAATTGAKVAIVNGRISDRSFPRYHALRSLVGRVLAPVHLFLAQTDEDARRLVAIGAPHERVHVGGNLKFDITPAVEKPFISELRSQIATAAARPVIVAGSTLEGEEAAVITAFRALLAHAPGALLVLAPRHPERFAAVADLLSCERVAFIRRSQWRGDEPLAGSVLLLDTIGELAAAYSLADAAFVGGSMMAHGGHNILEPAQFGVPVVTGPYMENFREIMRQFENAGAVVVSRDADELSRALIEITQDANRRHELGARGLEVVRQFTGATARTVAALTELLAK